MNGLLDNYKGAARQAHYWTSFSPEKRGEQLINDYNNQLTEDITELQEKGIDSETIEGYKNRYISLFRSWLSAKSRCFSAMITGPAKFPTRRHEKANRSEDNHYKLWQEWRLRAKKAIVRKAQPVKTYVSEIDRYKADLESMKKNHELMKQGNIMIKKAKKEGKDISEELKELLGINDFNANWAMRWGFGLQNNNANMKRVEQRIKELEVKENARQNNPEKSYKFNGGEVVINYEADRIQIIHDEKPSEEVRKELKSNGFNWSHSNKAWQRKITINAMYVTKRILNNLQNSDTTDKAVAC